MIICAAEHSGSVGRVLDWEPNGYQFESHHRQSQCVVSLSKELYLLLNTGSTQEDPSQYDRDKFTGM